MILVWGSMGHERGLRLGMYWIASPSGLICVLHHRVRKRGGTVDIMLTNLISFPRQDNQFFINLLFRLSVASLLLVLMSSLPACACHRLSRSPLPGSDVRFIVALFVLIVYWSGLFL